MPPPSHFGSYQRIARLATGGMGVVHLGLHPETRTLGAIKTMFRQHARDPQRRERFRKECLLHARLRHPHVVACMEAEPEGDPPWLVLEYLRGEPLDACLEGGRRPAAEVLELAEALAGALDHLHQQRVLHHDLKPSNVYRTRAGRFLLLDMGVAAEASVRTGSSRTFLYSAPEVNRQQRPDPRSDLYSLGLVLHEALTGQRVLGVTNLAGAVQVQATEHAPDPRQAAPETPAALAELALELTRPDPADRPGDARQVLVRLGEIRGGLDHVPAYGHARRQGRVLALGALQENEAALGLLDALERALPEDPWCPWVRARLTSARGRFVESLQHLREARARGLDPLLAREHEGLCLLQAGRQLEAHAAFEELAAARPEDPLAAGLLRWLEEA